MPARPCADSAPTGSSIHLSIASTPTTTITPATAPMIGAAHDLHVARRGRDGHQRGDRAVAGHADVDLLVFTVHQSDGGEHARGGREVRDHGDLREATVQRVQRRAGVEPEPAEPQDQDAEAEQRHVVPRDRPRLAVLAVLAAARAEQQQRREGAGGADQVDHGRAGEVLHADVGVQPAAAEDPVRADRVDQRREDDGVDDVDAELDPLERRAPDDRERDGAERRTGRRTCSRSWRPTGP